MFCLETHFSAETLSAFCLQVRKQYLNSTKSNCSKQWGVAVPTDNSSEHFGVELSIPLSPLAFVIKRLSWKPYFTWITQCMALAMLKGHQVPYKCYLKLSILQLRSIFYSSCPMDTFPLQSFQEVREISKESAYTLSVCIMSNTNAPGDCKQHGKQTEDRLPKAGDQSSIMKAVSYNINSIHLWQLMN